MPLEDLQQETNVSTAPGDGCASRVCAGKHHRPSKFGPRQAAMAAAVEAGTRMLVCMPATLDAPHYHLLPQPAREEAHPPTHLPTHPPANSTT